MAWNQPGGNGNRDPWGDRGKQEGPPDLDEALRKLQAWIKRLLGGGVSIPGKMQISGGGSGGSTGIVVLLIVALLGWGLWGFYTVDEAEQGVVLRFGKFVRITNPGLNWVPHLIEEVELVNVQAVHSADVGFREGGGSTSSVPHESLMLTQDENIIDIKFTVHYRISNPADYLFQVLDPENTLRQATEAAVREIVGRNTMDYVITEGRGDVAAKAVILIQEVLDIYKTGLVVTSVNMQDAQAPREVQDAFDDVVKAREDEERFKNEARAYKEDILPKARGDAEAVLEAAKAYREQVIARADGETDRFLKVLTEYRKAPAVTRQRLYLEAVESVMANSSKVLLDVDGGNNLMYLPIDKIISGSADTNRQQDDNNQSFETQGSTLSGFGSDADREDADLRTRTGQ